MTTLDGRFKLRLVLALAVTIGVFWLLDTLAWSHEAFLVGLTAGLALCGALALPACLLGVWSELPPRGRGYAGFLAFFWGTSMFLGLGWLPGTWAHTAGQPVTGEVTRIRKVYRRRGPFAFDVSYAFPTPGAMRSGREVLESDEVNGLAPGSRVEVRYVEEPVFASSLVIGRGIRPRGMAPVQAACALPLLWLLARRWGSEVRSVPVSADEEEGPEDSGGPPVSTR